MNVHISYKIAKTSDLEKQINHQLEKLGRYLQVFRPELVQLKGVLEANTSPGGFVMSLNLRLPSGQMASRQNSLSETAAVKATFDEITDQLKRHKELLRSRHKWLRRRGPGRAEVGTVPFEQTLAAIKPDQISSGDIAQYINANLPRLKRFIQRELDYRESQGQLLPDQVLADDVMGEAIANALSEQDDKPERIKLEPWLYRLAKQAIDQLAFQGGEESHVPLERSHGEQNVHGKNEARLQFHQPDERLSEENLIADPAANNPEELAARRESIRLVETTLRDAGRHEREAFILYTIEGFTLEEIADITNRTVEEVRASIRKAREHLQRALPLRDALREKLVEYSMSA